MTIGQNSVTGEMLRNHVEAIERLRAQRKEISDEITAEKAKAKSNGFTPKIIDRVVKRREKKPHDLQEYDQTTDMYLHALGMPGLGDGPLFRVTGVAGFDATVKDLVLDAMKQFVPAHGMGSIIVNMGGKPMRLERQKDGTVTVADVMEVPRPGPSLPEMKPKEPVPDVDEAGAEALGGQYARDNKPVIDNPFPYGDPRRARFDEGWRKESGNDGMGPADKD